MSGQGSLQSLLGDFNGDPNDDLRSRFGSLLTPPVSFERLYSEFGESWRVDNTGNSLFETSPAESSSPARFLSASTLTRSQRQAAEQICRNAGVAGSLLRDCILDVALLGDAQVAQSYTGLGSLDLETRLDLLSNIATGLGSPEGVALASEEEFAVVDSASVEVRRS
ncbi:MAG: hypothetical protein Q6L68_05500 [Thermostichus sp. DG02_5_bins_236]